jgi:hypothetical protein
MRDAGESEVQATSPPAFLLSRRSFFAASALAVVGASGWRDVLSARLAALGGAGLLQSYDVSGEAAFDRVQANCAYVYDNAVVGLALLSVGDVPGARRIGDALVYAQAHDRAWQDGRLRNAYRAGKAPGQGPYPLAGWWDNAAGRWLEDGYQAGTATGVLAWAMLLWIGLGGAYRKAALQAADFIEGQLRGPRGFTGGFIGFEPSPQRVAWVSTEHNIDLAAAFSALGRSGAAGHAAEFVASMWRPAEGRFAMGLRPDGGVNEGSAVDANLWPLLAGGAQPEWRRALSWVLAQHGVPRGPDPDGVDFNTDRDGIWLEGTAITALACKRLGQSAPRLMASLHKNTAPGGLIYATNVSRLTTGLSTGLDENAADFYYYRRPHISPTAWAVLAESGTTPFPQA